MTDERLLERFTTGKDDSAEAASTALVERHGPMVLGVCRQMLRDEHDAEDAFQATFLILAGEARSIRSRGLLENWLYKVAYRVALRARAASVRRRTAERKSVEAMARSTPDAVPADLVAVLHEEVNRLPERYRALVVLCYLKGQTNDAAARQLGWPLGTARGRLARARERLRGQLSRRGLALPSGLIVAALSPRAASAAVPTTLITATVRAALGVAGKASAAWAVSSSASALTNGAQRTVLLSRLRIAGTVLVAAGVVTGGVTGLAKQPAASGPQPAALATAGPRTDLDEAQPVPPSRPEEKSLTMTDPGREVREEREGERRGGERANVGEKPKNREGERVRTRERKKREGDRVKRREGEKPR